MCPPEPRDNLTGTADMLRVFAPLLVRRGDGARLISGTSLAVTAGDGANVAARTRRPVTPRRVHNVAKPRGPRAQETRAVR